MFFVIFAEWETNPQKHIKYYCEKRENSRFIPTSSSHCTSTSWLFSSECTSTSVVSKSSSGGRVSTSLLEMFGIFFGNLLKETGVKKQREETRSEKNKKIRRKNKNHLG